jgi:hypothetical protein
MRSFITERHIARTTFTRFLMPAVTPAAQHS